MKSTSSKMLAALAFAATAAMAVAVASQASTHYFSRKLALLTDHRYNHNCFLRGPHGVDYANLPGARPDQKPAQYPDVGATYFGLLFKLPTGARITLRGKFPYERYMSYAIQTRFPDGTQGAGDFLRDDQIVPDKGSINPFLPRNDRFAKSRDYTIHIVAGSVPAHRARNTIYTGATDPNASVELVQRNYLPDAGRDGTGDAGLPKLTVALSDGRTLRGTAACRALRAAYVPRTVGFPLATWKQLVASSADPVNAPARDPLRWERFWNAAYSVAGSFIANQAERARMYPPADVGGFASNPDTRYLATYADLNYGSVVTVTGKMPTFPDTLPASPVWQPRSYQVRYWSFCTGSAPPSGLAFDCAYDQQVPLHGDRRYTLVISKPADRPRNATTACGYLWLNFGKGEDYPGSGARDYLDTLYMRFMDANPSFAQAPQRVKTPNTEPQVMGPYYPHSKYWTKAAFQKLGCHNGTTS